MEQKSRNSFLAKGISRFSRSQMYSKRGLFKRQPYKVEAKAENTATTKSVPVNGEKNGQTRNVPVAGARAPRFYSAEDVAQPKKCRKVARPTRLRESIVPGTVLILLAGRFRGKRVVFLKQLDSGLLLVSGPFKINGVPVRRVNQAYVIATSTKVDLGDFQVDAKFNDAYFNKEKASKKKGAEEFFGDNKQKNAINPSRAADQKLVDQVVLSAVAKVPHMKHYLNATFTLHNKQAPHALRF